MQENLLHQLEQLKIVLTGILAEAQQNASESIEDFVADRVRKMGAMIGHYFSAFQALNVMSRKGVDEAVAKMHSSQKIQDAAEELFEAEDEWDSFLKEIDAKMNPSYNGKAGDLVVGSHGPCELEVTDVGSEKLVEMKQKYSLNAFLMCTIPSNLFWRLSSLNFCVKVSFWS